MRISCQKRYMRALAGSLPFVEICRGISFGPVCIEDWCRDYVCISYDIKDSHLSNRKTVLEAFLLVFQYHLGPEFIYLENYSPDSRKHLKNEQLVMHHWPYSKEIELYRYYKKYDERP